MEATESKLSYALITPARNEEAYIEKTIRSMIGQTVLPTAWIVVSDGSTDATDRIVQRYTQRYGWMELVRMPEHRDRQFAAKVASFNAGYARLRGKAYDLVGNLDADLSFEPDYFEFLLQRFAEDPRLGVGGTPFVEGAFRSYDHRFTNFEHVSGACQLFRRECFEQIGGYVPIRGGGIDWAAVTTARMKGWKTRTFPQKTLFHHRPIGTGMGRATVLASRFRHGIKDYCLGGHPLWQALRVMLQMRSRPYLLGGLALGAGYGWALLRRMPRPISAELMAFHRREQLQRIRRLLGGRRKAQAGYAAES